MIFAAVADVVAVIVTYGGSLLEREMWENHVARYNVHQISFQLTVHPTFSCIFIFFYLVSQSSVCQ